MELIKCTTKSLLKRLFAIINISWQFGCIPDEWNMTITFLIYKKGGRMLSRTTMASVC
jgi:hypothetical protein